MNLTLAVINSKFTEAHNEQQKADQEALRESTHVHIIDDDMENAFYSANNSKEAHDSSSVSKTTSPGLLTPQSEPGDSTPSPENDTQLRRSTRPRQAPPTLVYTEGFHQELVRTTKHQQRRPPTPVRKHPSQEDRDKIKLKRGKSLQKKPNI